MNKSGEKRLPSANTNSASANPNANANAVRKPTSISYKPRPRQHRNSSTSSDKACVVCYRDVKYSSVGTCEHPVCFECSSRMRVLLQQNECPICRQSLDHVIFTQVAKTYALLKDKIRMFVFIPKWSIYLEDDSIQASFDKLLEHKCSLCPEQPTFPEFEGLRDHIQRKHQLFSCDLCVEHIKHFSKERKFYTRSDLAHHKRKGDRNDTSHRGHPLCQFCDQRFFDNDELFKHLRKDHYFCHFCDAEGYNHYYNTYDDLRLHYRKEHFLCEEEHCAQEKFTSVFRTDIDLKAHLASSHSRLLGKHGTKQARTLEIEFALPKRPENERGRFGRPYGGGHGGRDHERGDRDRDRDRDRERRNGHGRDRGGGGNERDAMTGEEEIFIGVEMVQVPTVQPKMDSAIDFPSLDGASGGGPTPSSINGSSIAQKVALNSGMNVRPSQTWKGKTTREYDFPALDGSTGPPSTMVTPSVVQYGKMGMGGGVQQRPKTGGGERGNREEDFPTLPTSSRNPGRGGSIWSGTGPASKLRAQDNNGYDNEQLRGQPRVKKVAPCPVLKDEPNPSSDFNFVPLSVSSRSSKAAGGGSKFSEPSSEPEVSAEEAEPTKNGKKGKKKESSGIALAAAALFNGGTAPTKVAHKPKVPFQAPAGEPVEDFPSLPPPVAKKGGVVPVRKSPKVPPAPPPVRKISPPPGFQLKRSDEVGEVMEFNSQPHPPPSSSSSSSFVVAQKENLSKPPPGFESVQPPLNSSSQVNFLENVLELNEMSVPKGGEYSMYRQPKDMKTRNEHLLEGIKGSLNSDEATYQSFLTLSTLFRKDEVPAQEYYDLCQTMFGMLDFRIIFTELLVLLPDIQKQQELLVTHRNCGGGKGELLSTCHICHQVLKKGDVAFHIQSHANDKDSFPSLSTLTSNTNRKK